MALKRWDLVDEQELKRMALRVLLKGLCCSILFTILFFLFLKIHLYVSSSLWVLFMEQFIVLSLHIIVTG